jgi:hypothetical protein
MWEGHVLDRMTLPSASAPLPTPSLKIETRGQNGERFVRIQLIFTLPNHLKWGNQYSMYIYSYGYSCQPRDCNPDFCRIPTFRDSNPEALFLITCNKIKCILKKKLFSHLYFAKITHKISKSMCLKNVVVKTLEILVIFDKICTLSTKICLKSGISVSG